MQTLDKEIEALKLEISVMKRQQRDSKKW